MAAVGQIAGDKADTAFMVFADLRPQSFSQQLVAEAETKLRPVIGQRLFDGLFFCNQKREFFFLINIRATPQNQ